MKIKILGVLRFFAVILTLSLCLASFSIAGDITIICNQSVAETMVSKSDLKKIFRGNLSRWDDNSRITIALLDNAEINQSFFKRFIGMSSSKYERYIKKKIHTSGFKQPATLKSEKEMIDYVASTKGAVGYVTTDPDNWGTWLIKPLAVK